MVQMKEQNTTSEKDLNETEIAKLSDAEFKTLVIRMLREITEYGKYTREEMKANFTKWNKEKSTGNPQFPEGKEAGIQINDLEHKERIDIQPE